MKADNEATEWWGLTMAEYPTADQLDKIIAWDAQHDPKGLADYVKGLWWMPDWGFRLHRGRNSLVKKRVVKLQLHTGGWSGNESIIGALRDNFTFWVLYWEKSIRGGHYWFEFPVGKWKGGDADE